MFAETTYDSHATHLICAKDIFSSDIFISALNKFVLRASWFKLYFKFYQRFIPFGHFFETQGLFQCSCIVISSTNVILHFTSVHDTVFHRARSRLVGKQLISTGKVQPWCATHVTSLTLDTEFITDVALADCKLVENARLRVGDGLS